MALDGDDELQGNSEQRQIRPWRRRCCWKLAGEVDVWDGQRIIVDVLLGGVRRRGLKQKGKEEKKKCDGELMKIYSNQTK